VDELVKVLVGGEQLRGELLVEQRAAGLDVVELGGRVERGGRPAAG